MGKVLDDLQLSLMTFPQRWDGAAGKLQVNLLLLPVGDPVAPLGGGPGPQFAGTSVSLVINIVSGLGALPTIASAPAISRAFVAVPPPVAPALFTALKAQLVAKGATVTSGHLDKVPPATARIRKSLPDSYTQAFPFDGPRTSDLSVGDGYGCALKAQDPGLGKSLPPPTIAWGQILSYALRQPELARALGLIYTITLDVSDGTLTNGGFAYTTLDDANPANPWVKDWQDNRFKVKSYAARLPQLGATDNRALFAATLLPVLDVAPSNLTEAQFEAEQYDDGFAQIVHCNQPTTIDAVTLDQKQIAPGTEAGIQLGWDDEQLTVWLNNQVDLLRDRVQTKLNNAFVPTRPEAPLGVQGYRVDVREKGTVTWRSLCVVNGSLPFDNNAVGSPAMTSINGNELWVTPVPIRPLPAVVGGDNQAEAWLPLYFAQWLGSSLVVDNPVTAQLISALTHPAAPVPDQPARKPNANLIGVPVLRYGTEYEFRVRLVDLTGGGALHDDPIVHPGPAAQPLCKFRRYIPPKTLEVQSDPAVPPFPARPPDVRTIDTLTLQRPRIGYPEAIFAGVDPNTFSSANLKALIEGARLTGRAISVPDPDVDSVEVRVEARIPNHDTGLEGTLAGELDGNFRVIYSTIVHFPTDQGDDPTITLSLQYLDGIDDIASVDAPPDDSTTLPIPSARDIRIRLFPQCIPRTNYYGTLTPPIGLSSDYIVRKNATAEDAIFPTTPQTQLQGFYFQPGSNIPQLLAQKLDLQVQDLTLSGSPGVRVVFGCSGALRHSISADGGSLTFSNQTELLGHWIVALVFDMERDWTWDGWGTPGVQVQRDAESAPIGTLIVPRTVAASAAGSLTKAPDRPHSRIIFFDALNPLPESGKPPKELNPKYVVTATFDVAPSQQHTLSIRLPITTPPGQTMKIASTGIAQTDFHHSPDYSETSLRDRYLWIEFEEPIADEQDSYFARVLAYGPDPLLAAKLHPASSPAGMLPNKSPEPDLPIDPEPMRWIFSGQSPDQSGLEAMTELIPANNVSVGKSGKFFLMLLPPGLSKETLELFGFWTYEFRVGHKKNWSTAQGRFGRPLRVAGIQHPAPHLICAVQRVPKHIEVNAPYATTVYNGKRLFDFTAGDPQTSLWFLLYAQVMQADGASHRNVLLTRHLGRTVRPRQDRPIFGENHKVLFQLDPQHGNTREPRATTSFLEDEVLSLLRKLDLPKATSLSVLAVEVLPGEPRIVQRDFRNLQADTVSQPLSASVRGEDPLGTQLGQRRILRVSPLTAVPVIC
jgi:hypothetical protein